MQLFKCKIPKLLIFLSLFGCLANTEPEGNPLDPGKPEGLLLLLDLNLQWQRNRFNSFGGSAGQQSLVWTTFTHGLQIKSVAKVGTTIYALVNISATATPNYRLHSSTDGITFTAIGTTFASGNNSIDRIIYFDNKLIVYSSNVTSIPNPIFVSTDTGTNWISTAPIVTPGTAENFTCLTGSGTNTYAMYETEFYTSIDNGVNFGSNTAHSGIIPRRNSYCLRENDTYYMVGGQRTSNNIATADILTSSTSAPGTWTNANNGSFGNAPFQTQDCASNMGSNFGFTTLSTNNWVIVNNNYLSQSSDSGANWNCRNIRTTDNTSISIGLGRLTNIGNRVFGYAPEFSNFDKGVYIDLE